MATKIAGATSVRAPVPPAIHNQKNLLRRLFSSMLLTLLLVVILRSPPSGRAYAYFPYLRRIAQISSMCSSSSSTSSLRNSWVLLACRPDQSLHRSLHDRSCEGTPCAHPFRLSPKGALLDE